MSGTYEAITNSIVDSIRQGVDDWVEPFSLFKTFEASSEEASLRANKFIWQGPTPQIEIRHGGYVPWYDSSCDVIKLPNKENFTSTAEYYTAVFRLLSDRVRHDTPDYRDYDFEKIVSGLAGAFLCNDFGFEGKVQHAEYIRRWSQSFPNDFEVIRQASECAEEVVGTLYKGFASKRNSEAEGKYWLSPWHPSNFVMVETEPEPSFLQRAWGLVSGLWNWIRK